MHYGIIFKLLISLCLIIFFTYYDDILIKISYQNTIVCFIDKVKYFNFKAGLCISKYKAEKAINFFFNLALKCTFYMNFAKKVFSLRFACFLARARAKTRALKSSVYNFLV